MALTVADRSLPREAQALLRAIAKPESGGRYNVRFDGSATGATFNDFADHPRVLADIPGGFAAAGQKSSAAGRYQFVRKTWDEAAEAVGATDFSPENQDRAAWWLAQRDYKARTGTDLLADLQSGKAAQARKALAGTWEGLSRVSDDEFTAEVSTGVRLADASGLPRIEIIREAMRRGLIDKSALEAEAARRGLSAGNPPPAGMTAQQAADAAMSGAIADNNKPEVLAERAYRNSPIASGLASAVKGVPLLGEYVDEGIGLIGGPEARDRVNMATKGYETANPNLAMGGQIAAGLVTGLPMAMAAGPAVAARAGSSALANVARSAVAGLVAGATEGAVSGYGRGDGEGRMSSAADGALIGGGLGAVVGGAAPLAARGMSNLVSAVRGRPDAAAAKALGGSQESAEIVGRMLANDDPAQAAARIGAGGPGGMVADAGPATAGLLDAAIQKAGPGGRIARDAIETRATDATGDMVTALDRFLGRPVGVRRAAKDIAGASSALRQRAYDAAYAAPIDYAGKGQAVEEVLSRIPPRIMSQAVRDANEDMISRGVKNRQVMFDADAGTFSEMPNVQQLDAIKQALDRLGSEVDVFGRPTAGALMPRRLARQLGEATKEAVPEYRRAVALGGQKIAEDQSLEIGRRLLATRTTREEVADAMKGATPATMRAAKQGIREQIDEAMSNVRRAVGDSNMDAREGIQVLRDLSSRASREKLRLVLGDQPAAELLTKVDQAAKAFELRASTATNSKTFSRQSMDAAIKAATAPGMIGDLMSGSPVGAARKLAQSMTGMTDQARQAVEERVAGEIATMLTQRRGPDAQKAAAELIRLLERQPATEALAQRIGQATGASVAVGGYQSGTQYLNTR